MPTKSDILSYKSNKFSARPARSSVPLWQPLIEERVEFLKYTHPKRDPIEWWAQKLRLPSRGVILGHISENIRPSRLKKIYTILRDSREPRIDEYRNWKYDSSKQYLEARQGIKTSFQKKYEYLFNNAKILVG